MQAAPAHEIVGRPGDLVPAAKPGIAGEDREEIPDFGDQPRPPAQEALNEIVMG